MNLQEYQAIVGSTAQEFAETGLSVHQLFQWQIKKMNEMYELPINIEPSLDHLEEPTLQRMQGFMKTLQKEMDEGREILALLKVRQEFIDSDCTSFTFHTEHNLAQSLEPHVHSREHATNLAQAVLPLMENTDEVLTPLESFSRVILVMIADWLGDMTVYNRSEALKYGIPLESVLACIMGSNFTKLGEDGLPIKDENGKVQKGPNFRWPEEAIYATMFEKEQLVHEVQNLLEAADSISALALPVLQDPMAEVLFSSEDDVDLESEDDFMLPQQDEKDEKDEKYGDYNDL